MTTGKSVDRRKETDLYTPIKQYWESRGYEVRAEVRHCDIVAIHPDQPDYPIIIELKSSINLTLVLQALERQKSAEVVYIAAEQKRSARDGRKRLNAVTALCRRLGIGLMTVTFYARKPAFVEVHCTPQGAISADGAPSDELHVAWRKPTRIKTRTSRLVREFSARSGDYNVAGSAKRPLVTAYREKALRVAAVLSQGPNRPARVRDCSGVGETAAILQRNVYDWFIRIERGIYKLSPAGEAALIEYADVLTHSLEATPFMEKSSH